VNPPPYLHSCPLSIDEVLSFYSRCVIRAAPAPRAS
jgi:hypothetical protein